MEKVIKKKRIINFVKCRNKLLEKLDKEKNSIYSMFNLPGSDSINLSGEEKEFFEERAAIIEHDAGVSHEVAELEAVKATIKYFRPVKQLLKSIVNK